MNSKKWTNSVRPNLARGHSAMPAGPWWQPAKMAQHLPGPAQTQNWPSQPVPVGALARANAAVTTHRLCAVAWSSVADQQCGLHHSHLWRMGNPLSKPPWAGAHARGVATWRRRRRGSVMVFISNEGGWCSVMTPLSTYIIGGRRGTWGSGQSGGMVVRGQLSLERGTQRRWRLWIWCGEWRFGGRCRQDVTKVGWGCSSSVGVEGEELGRAHEKNWTATAPATFKGGIGAAVGSSALTQQRGRMAVRLSSMSGGQCR
jgi:hypothetical protein